MLDFRYHALSLVAVFLALAIGIVLGVTIGDSLLTDAERSLRSNLSAKVVDALHNERQAPSDLSGRDPLPDQTYPQLASRPLRGERVAIVSWGPLPAGAQSGGRGALHNGGAPRDSGPARPH